MHCHSMLLSQEAFGRHRRRWLLGLLVLQSSSSFILDRYEALIREHLFITLFLTMLVGAGGNAGNQSAIKVIRGLVRARCARWLWTGDPRALLWLSPGAVTAGHRDYSAYHSITEACPETTGFSGASAGGRSLRSYLGANPRHC